ncbi:MAG TPA: glycosyltransferase family 2 protein [Tepidisphaeraceae bacterium]|jgi:glycosyltransferase involved in cell wall biosynthesis|nr:glycosyltransferase family 2 protein [Tepidisphaeraceae bacterium]
MPTKAPIAIVFTTKNEEANLAYALASVVDWAQEVFVVDSGSTDNTEEITRSFGVDFTFHAWEGYARQKNWAVDNLPITTPWVFILDADESITPELRDELIKVATDNSCLENAFFINRFFIFLDKRIHHCGYYPSWNIRFFRRGMARYELRDVHEHMLVEGKTGYLKCDMEHNDRRGLEFYIAKHNQYSTLEAREMYKLMLGQSTKSPEHFWDGPTGRRRWIKQNIWPRLPARWFWRWVYMYILRFGFLDGYVGFHFCLFLAAYEHQITLKLREQFQAARAPAPPAPKPHLSK